MILKQLNLGNKVIGSIPKPCDIKVDSTDGEYTETVTSANLLNISDVAETTAGGVTYSIKNGVITLSGTTTATFSITLFDKASGDTDFVGTYIVKNFGTLSNSYLNVWYGNPNGTAFTWASTNHRVIAVYIESGVTLNGTLKPMLVSGSTAPTEYQHYFSPYTRTYDKYHLAKYTEYTDTATNSVNEPILLEDEYTPSKQETDKAYFSFDGKSEVVKSVNLIDKSAMVDGYLKGSDTLEIVSPDYGNKVTDYLAVKPNTTYTYTCGGYDSTSTNMPYWTGYAFFSAVGTKSSVDYSRHATASTTYTSQTVSFTTPSDCYYIRIGSRFLAYDSAWVCLKEGTSTTYTPYFEPYIRNFGVRNLFDLSKTRLTASTTSNGVTLTPIDKYSFLADGTATANTTIALTSNNQLLSKYFDFVNGHKYYVWFSDSNNSSRIYYDGIGWRMSNSSFTYKTGDTGALMLYISSGSTYDNEVIKWCVIDITNNDSFSNPSFYIPSDSTYYAVSGSTPIPLGTSPLRSGDILYTDGVRKNNRAVVDLGTLTWSLVSGYTDLFRSDISTKAVGEKNITCAMYEIDTSSLANMGNMTIKGNSAVASALFIRNSSYSTASAFTTAMSGVMLEYELATPTAEIVTPTALGNTSTTCTDGNNTQTLTKYADMYTLDYGHCKVSIGDDSVNISYYDKLYAKNNVQYWTRSKSALSVSAITSRMLTEDTSDGSFYYQVKVLDIEYSSLPMNTYVSGNKIHFLDERGLLTTADLYVAYLNKHTEAIIIYGMYVGTVTSTLTTPSTPTQIEGTVIDVDGTFAGKVYYAKQL